MVVFFFFWNTTNYSLSVPLNPLKRGIMRLQSNDSTLWEGSPRLSNIHSIILFFFSEKFIQATIQAPDEISKQCHRWTIASNCPMLS